MKKLEITQTPIEVLKRYPQNTRHHPEDQIALLKNSLVEYGWTNPILINKENVVIAGHARLQAASELNLRNVPTIMLEDLSEDQQRAYRITDNRIAELGFWDMPNLKEELQALDKLEFDMDLTGFTDEYLEAIGIDEIAVTQDQEKEPWDEDIHNPKMIDKHRHDYAKRRVALYFCEEDETWDSFMAWLESIEAKWTYLQISNKRPMIAWFPDRPEPLDAKMYEEDEEEENEE